MLRKQCELDEGVIRLVVHEVRLNAVVEPLHHEVSTGDLHDIPFAVVHGYDHLGERLNELQAAALSAEALQDVHFSGRTASSGSSHRNLVGSVEELDGYVLAGSGVEGTEDHREGTADRRLVGCRC